MVILLFSRVHKMKRQTERERETGAEVRREGKTEGKKQGREWRQRREMKYSLHKVIYLVIQVLYLAFLCGAETLVVVKLLHKCEQLI